MGACKLQQLPQPLPLARREIAEIHGDQVPFCNEGKGCECQEFTPGRNNTDSRQHPTGKAVLCVLAESISSSSFYHSLTSVSTRRRGATALKNCATGLSVDGLCFPISTDCADGDRSSTGFGSDEICRDFCDCFDSRMNLHLHRAGRSEVSSQRVCDGHHGPFVYASALIAVMNYRCSLTLRGCCCFAWHMLAERGARVIKVPMP